MKKASISPKHYPLALARAVDNGPARWYLEERECKNPRRYAICEVYGTSIPLTVQEMLWSKDSLIVRATPRQLDRVRAEERNILIETTKRYPLQQLYLVAHDVPEQLIVFRLNYFRYDSEIVRNAAGDIILRTPPGEARQSALYAGLEAVNDAMVALGAFALLWMWRGMSSAQRSVIVIMLTGREQFPERGEIIRKDSSAQYLPSLLGHSLLQRRSRSIWALAPRRTI